MDENTKRRCDTIYQLCKDSWGRISERRHYEWRAAFTLWGAFGAFIVIMVTKPLPVSTTYLFWGVFALGLCLFVIHIIWLKGLGQKIDDDREMAIHYEKILQDLSDSKFDKELREQLDKQPKQRGICRDWSRRCQLVITFILWVALILTVLAVGNWN